MDHFGSAGRDCFRNVIQQSRKPDWNFGRPLLRYAEKQWHKAHNRGEEEDVVYLTLTGDAPRNSKYKSELAKQNQWGTKKKGHISELSPMDLVDRFWTELIKKTEVGKLRIKPKSRAVYPYSSMLASSFVGVWFLDVDAQNDRRWWPRWTNFNIGKSRAALFDAENKVKITFEDVAGPMKPKKKLKRLLNSENPGVHQTGRKNSERCTVGWPSWYR